MIKSSLAGASIIWIVAVSGAHAQATINDCEKIQAADAYNQCLAKFGPASKVKSMEPGKPSDFKDNGEQAAATAEAKPSGKSVRRGSHRRGRAVKSRGGRKRMTIRVGKHKR